MNKEWKNTTFGLPYMGRKAKIAKDIVDKILEIKPNTKYIYDLFAGGGSISFEFAQRPNIKKVFYNDLDKAVILLIEKLFTDGFTDEFLQWVSPDIYKQYKNEISWFGGLLHIVWSFGNNRSKSYLYGKNKIQVKHWLHKIVIDKDMSAISKLEQVLHVSLPREILNIDFWNDRRLKLLQFLKKELAKTYRLQHLSQLFHLYKLATQFKFIEKITLYSQDYKEVPIATPISETIIYLDPPYQNTTLYHYKINYNEFCNYIHSSPYPVFVSSYENTCGLKEIWSKEKRVLLNANSNSMKKTEKLFYNEK